ncbi:density-regulated protein DRP1 [Pluteus cervinus]|uniref:Density-regulated protein DRP1 n=1 Tax=Pluteus cervinus TaxID=181527 RepID=A0ACD3AU50_9AGAR|nr:density-regulated protein DRP1 [Pluteus cervinus]
MARKKQHNKDKEEATPASTSAAAASASAPTEEGGEAQPTAAVVAPEEPQPPPPEPHPPVEVAYCGVCTFPLEYCEFGSSLTRCKDWLKEADSDLFDKYYSEEALQAKIGTLSLEAQTKLEKDTAKKEAKAEAKADAAHKKKMASQITIKRIERTKRKFVTSIHGLEAFSIDLKKAAKQFASRFATGASVTKNPQGQDEIVVQGDVSDEIVEMIEGGVGVLKGIPADNIELVEEKKKAGGAGAGGS